MIDAPPVPPEITQVVIAPKRPYAGGRPVGLRLRFTSPGGPADLRVEIRRGRRLAKRFLVRGAAPPGPVRLRWSTAAAREGRHTVSGGPTGGRLKRLGGFTVRGGVFPVRGPHGARGGAGLFGAGRNGGRTHEGFDILAACGTPVVAARGGVVKRRYFDPVLYGNNVIVRGAGQRREYWYSHLRAPGRVAAGGRVRTGQLLGHIGQTGNARGTPCHLHFEIHGPAGPFDPLPRLRQWNVYS